MKQSQKESILSLLRQAPDRKVSCRTLADNYLYHHASQRIGELVRKEGYDIRFVKGETWDSGYYELYGEGKESVPHKDDYAKSGSAKKEDGKLEGAHTPLSFIPHLPSPKFEEENGQLLWI